MTWQVLQIEPGWNGSAGTTTIMGEGENDILAIANCIVRYKAISEGVDLGIEPSFEDIIADNEGCGFLVVLHNTAP
jgi:hypothetical protein